MVTRWDHSRLLFAVLIALAVVTPAAAAPTPEVGLRLPALRWSFNTGHQYDVTQVSPVVAGGAVYAADEGGLYAFDAATGRLRWRHDDDPSGRNFGQWIRFLAAGSGIVCVSTDGEIRGLDAATGAVRWRIVTGYATPVDVVGRTAVFLDQQGSIHALDAASGEQRWSQSFSDAAAPGSALTVDAHTVYAGTRGGFLYAYDLATGARRWGDLIVPGNTTDALTLARGAIYVIAAQPLGEHPTLTVLDAATGRSRPGFALTTPLDARVGITVTGGMLYAMTADRPTLLAADAATGRERWRATVPVQSIRPVVAGGLVYIVTTDGALAALDTTNGTVRWRLRLGGWLVAPPTVAAGRLYAAAVDHVVYAVDPRGTPLPASAPAPVAGAPTSDQLLLQAMVNHVPPSPAYVGLWRVTFATGARVPEPSFPGVAVAYLAAGALHREGNMLVNTGTEPAILLLAAMLPPTAVPLHLAGSGVTVALLTGGVAPVPRDHALLRLRLQTYAAGAVLPPELAVWPDALVAESGGVAFAVAGGTAQLTRGGQRTETTSATLAAGDGVLLPGGTVRFVREAPGTPLTARNALVAGCTGERGPAAGGASPAPSTTTAMPSATATGTMAGFSLFDLSVWGYIALGGCAASPPDFSFGS